MKANIPANLLAAQLLSAHKQFHHQFTDSQRALAVQMLTTHIEATRRLGTPGSLKVAATDTIFMASLNETAYEPIPVHSTSIASSLSDSHTGVWAEEL